MRDREIDELDCFAPVHDDAERLLHDDLGCLSKPEVHFGLAAPDATES
jgi:hypothetical protein